jgi:hypothetical protein
LTRSASISAPSLCSALAIADSTTFLMIFAPFLGEGQNVESLLDRLAADQIRNQTTLLFRQANAAENGFGFHRHISLALGLLAGGVTLERPGQREFAELVTNHVFRNVHRDVLTAVMDGDRQTDNPAAQWSDATKS